MKNINPNESQSQLQNKQILAHLKSGQKLTALDAMRLFGCMRLSARIFDLRTQGNQIGDEFVQDPVSGKRFKQFFMETGK